MLQLEDILTLDEDKENRSAVNSYPCSVIKCDTPVTLAVNATQSVLAVCVRNSSGILIHLYRISDYAAVVSDTVVISTLLVFNWGTDYIK